MSKDLKSLDQSFAALSAKFKTIRSAAPADDRTAQMCDHLYNMMGNLRDQMYAMADNNSTTWQGHQKGHVPSLTPSQMESFLETIGADGDYEVKKPTINCKASRFIEIEYKKKDHAKKA